MHVSFVLVDTAVPEHAGAAARALKTMGFSDLRFVRPRCDPRGDKAMWTAHGSQDVLSAAAFFDDVGSAVEDADLVAATTARRRGSRREYLDCASLAPYLLERRAVIARAAIVFGGEESGLSNQDLEPADLVTSVPMAAVQPTLSLSQAVMLYAYLLADLSPVPSGLPAGSPAPRSRVADQASGSWRVLRERLQALIEAAGIDRRTSLGQGLMERASLLGVDDMKLVHSLSTRLLARLRP